MKTKSSQKVDAVANSQRKSSKAVVDNPRNSSKQAKAIVSSGHNYKESDVKAEASQMTVKKAKQYYSQLNNNVSQNRLFLYELDKHKAFLLLGIPTRKDFLQGLPISLVQASREISAATVEVNLGIEIGTIKESVLRPLFKYAPEQQRRVWQFAEKNMKEKRPQQTQLTAKNIQSVLKYLKLTQENKAPKSALKIAIAVFKKLSEDDQKEFLDTIRLLNKITK